MTDQPKDQTNLKNQPADTNRPSTADIAASGSSPAPRDNTAPAHRVPGEQPGPMAALLPSDQTAQFRTRWTDIQAAFVDDPRRSVEQADTLVAEVMKRLAEMFADERSRLEGQWSKGSDVSTEDLRVALQRYRSFFDLLLSL